MLAPGRRALGFAVGREWLPAFFAGLGIEVLATDLDPEDARARAWIETGQHAPAGDKLFQPHLVGEEAFARLVRHRAVDMNAIPEDLKRGRFDFLWSVCSLEHLGSLERGEDFVVEAMRCLRPGGVAVHTTEFNLDAEGDGAAGRGGAPDAAPRFASRHGGAGPPRGPAPLPARGRLSLRGGGGAASPPGAGRLPGHLGGDCGAGAAPGALTAP
mgnify:CR=1 FL=1